MSNKLYTLWGRTYEQVKDMLDALRVVVMVCPTCGTALRAVDFAKPEWTKLDLLCAIKPGAAATCPNCETIVFRRDNNRIDILRPASQMDADKAQKKLTEVSDADRHQQPEQL